ncbi:hypothetical protein [Thermoclostridium stercorarium]|uniref:hypothetical protein n=2 Tax=Thermoclostridium stercorarium TaxID=1510 RepID=UPI000A4E1948|nr:hypothetical protein [Thermoclostridium stercorarium]
MYGKQPAFFIVFFVVILMLLSGCNEKTFSLDSGRYVPDYTKDEKDINIVPYIFIDKDKFSIIQDIAVSYQPSGTLIRKGNEVVMETVFADESYKWVFTLVDNNKLKFVLKKSVIPNNHFEWEDGRLFSLTDE